MQVVEHGTVMPRDVVSGILVAGAVCCQVPHYGAVGKLTKWWAVVPVMVVTIVAVVGLNNFTIYLKFVS
jgi:hypothetical protein